MNYFVFDIKILILVSLYRLQKCYPRQEH